MTKTIKVVLILVGFIVLLGIKVAFNADSEGGILWGIFLMAYLAYVRAIWRHEKKPDSENELDKSIK